MTFFNRAISKQDRISLGHLSCQLEFSAIWSEEGSKFLHNLEILIKPLGIPHSLEVHAWFSLDSVELLNVLKRAVHPIIFQLEQWINSNQQEFKHKMLELFLDSFTYQRSLIGVEAGKFFGSY